MKNTLKYSCLLLAGCALLSGCIMPESIKDYYRFVEDQVVPNPNITSEQISTDEFSLFYRTNGQPVNAIAVWVHGTPGSWKDIGKLLIDEGFLSKVLLVSLDRPGWGNSQLKTNPGILPGFDDQTRLMAPLLIRLHQEYPDAPLILVGHSWGGSLVPYIASEYPELVDGVIVLAGGLDPALVKPRWYNKAGTLIYPLLSKSMQGANDEVYALSRQLEGMSNRWASLNMPVIVVQGDKDSLVDPDNALYAEQRLNPANSHVLRLPNQGHLLQIERTDLIARCILAMASDDLPKCSEQAEAP